MTILVSAKLGKTKMHFTIHNSLRIEKLSELCHEAFSLNHSQTERGSIDCQVQMSNEFLRVECSVQHQDWQFLLILDESRFYLLTDHEIV
jgi:hypothetical protein